MLKVLTLVGTRPELIKLSRVIAEFDRQFDHVLAHTGQNFDFELNEVFFQEMGIRRPDHFLDAAGDTSSKTIANVIARTDELLAEVKPDAFLIYGDTNSCLGVIPAKRHQIPVFHCEAGNRCFDERVPEEINRRIVDHLSDINMVLTEHARRYLLREGILGDRIFKTGSHMDEVLEYHCDQISASDVLARENLEPGKYFVVSSHREENVDSMETIRQMTTVLSNLVEEYGFPVFVSTHPRTRKRLDEMGSLVTNPLVRFSKPLGFFDYIRLQKDAYCVLSDSGTIFEESALLGFPAVTLRASHERPEGIDSGVLVLSNFQSDHLMAAIELARETRQDNVVVPDYLGGNVSKKVARIVAGYVDFVNEKVWHK